LLINDQSFSIFKILNELNENVAVTDLSSWVADQFQLQQISSAIKAIDMLKAVVNGMINDNSKIFGFNTAVRNYLQKYEDSRNIDKYQLLEENQADIILKDLDSIKQQFELAKSLSDSNGLSQEQNNQKTQEVFQNLLLKRFENLGNLTIEGVDVSTLIKDVINSDDEQEYKVTKISEILYEIINHNSDNYEKLFNAFNFDLNKITLK
jgi:hypothetical protein